MMLFITRITIYKVLIKLPCSVFKQDFYQLVPILLSDKLYIVNK